MTKSLIPRPFWFPFSWDEDESWPLQEGASSGIDISEDGSNVYVGVAVPGLKPEEIEVTFEKGILWIKAEKKEVEEDKKKKYYRKATRSYSYRVAVPGQVDSNKEPEASYKDGVMTVTFSKAQKTEPKRIQVKAHQK